jgi:hypothetical protein
MASRIFGTYQIDYVDDRGTTRTLRAKTAFPPDSTQGQAEDIVNNTIGGILVKYGQTIVRQDLANPICSDSDSIKPRRLEFIRSNGNSISFAMPVRTNLVADGDTITSIINTFGGAFDVVCVKLHGEKATQLFDELGGTFAGTAVAPPRGTGSKQHTWHGTLQYESDGVFGSVKLLPFKIFSDVDNAVPTWMQGAAGSCLTLGNAQACTGRDPRTSRRYIATVLGTGVGEFKAEVPVTGSNDAFILGCGTTLANTAGVYCLDYRGEFNDRFHKVLPSFAP